MTHSCIDHRIPFLLWANQVWTVNDTGIPWHKQLSCGDFCHPLVFVFKTHTLQPPLQCFFVQITCRSFRPQHLTPLGKNIDKKERGRNTNLVFGWNFIQSLFICEPFVWGLVHYKCICLCIFAVGVQKHGCYFKIKTDTDMRCLEHSRWESDLLLCLWAGLGTGLFFGKAGQHWKWLFALLEASSKHTRANGAARCILYTDISNRQKAPFVQDNRSAINTLISCTLEQIHCSPVHDALTSSFPPWLCSFAILVAGPLVRFPMSHLGCSQTEIAVSLIAKRLVHVGGKNPCEEHAWYIKHSPLPVLNNNLIILSCVQRRRMLLILFNPLWVLN